MKILHLTLSKKPFEVMVTGEKDIEFRSSSDWIRSRLIDKNGNTKDYTHVKFVNGYGSDKPYFIAEYEGFEIVHHDSISKVYSNGLEVDIPKGSYVINLGQITEKGNLP